MHDQPKWIRSTETLTHWRATHSLEKYSPILISDSESQICSNTGEGLTLWMPPILVSGSDLLKHWRGTYFLDGCLPILVSGSDLLKHWRGTHFLDECSPFWSVVQTCSNTGEGLTLWMGVHGFSSVVWICSKLERDSLPGWGFTHSCQWFVSPQTLERDSLPRWVFTRSHQWIRSAQTLERDSQTGWVFTHSCQRFRSAQTLERDSLPTWVFTRSGPFSSVDQICLNTGEGLTNWMGIHPF